MLQFKLDPQTAPFLFQHKKWRTFSLDVDNKTTASFFSGNYHIPFFHKSRFFGNYHISFFHPFLHFTCQLFRFISSNCLYSFLFAYLFQCSFLVANLAIFFFFLVSIAKILNFLRTKQTWLFMGVTWLFLIFFLIFCSNGLLAKLFL